MNEYREMEQVEPPESDRFWRDFTWVLGAHLIAVLLIWAVGFFTAKKQENIQWLDGGMMGAPAAPVAPAESGEEPQAPEAQVPPAEPESPPPPVSPQPAPKVEPPLKDPEFAEKKETPTPAPTPTPTPRPATPKPATPKPATPKPATPKPATPKPEKPKTTAKPATTPKPETAKVSKPKASTTPKPVTKAEPNPASTTDATAKAPTSKPPSDPKFTREGANGAGRADTAANSGEGRAAKPGGMDRNALREGYGNIVGGRLKRAGEPRKPVSAAGDNREYSVLLRFRVARDGSVISTVIETPSGNPLIDNWIKETIPDFQRVPPPPQELLKEGIYEDLLEVIYTL